MVEQASGGALDEVDVDVLAAALGRGAFVLDVRRLDEYVEAHVPGAVLVPLDQLPSRLGDVPTDRELFVICRSGARSANAVRVLATAGIAATNVVGGTLAWLDAGQPVVTGSLPG